MSVKKYMLALCMLATATTASADWTGGVEAGASFGSSDSPAIRFYANNSADPLSHYMYLDYIRESGSNNYRLGYNPTFRISHSVYSFGRFSVEEDEPSGIEREFEASVGVGNNLFSRGNTRVQVEAGVGAQHLRFVDNSSDETDGFAFLAGNLRTSVLALLRFDASVGAKLNGDSTTLDGEAGFSIPIGPNTQLRYVYQVQRFNFDDRENIVDEDTFFTVSYGF